MTYQPSNKAPVAQWIERLFPKQKVVGSTPTWRGEFFITFNFPRLLVSCSLLLFFNHRLHLSCFLLLSSFLRKKQIDISSHLPVKAVFSYQKRRSQNSLKKKFCSFPEKYKRPEDGDLVLYNFPLFHTWFWLTPYYLCSYAHIAISIKLLFTYHERLKLRLHSFWGQRQKANFDQKNGAYGKG